MKIYDIAAAIVHRDGGIAMVRQKAPEGQAGYFWVLPGGKVEAGETYEEAVLREVREETGLCALSCPAHVYDCVYLNGAQGFECRVKMYEFTAMAGDFLLDDPDGDVEAAAFFSRAEVLEKLSVLPWPMVREPAVGYLSAQALCGAQWKYVADDDGVYRCVARG